MGVFLPSSHSIVPLLPAFGGFRERHGQLPRSQQRLDIVAHGVEHRFDPEIICDLLPGTGRFAERQQIRFVCLLTVLRGSLCRSLIIQDNNELIAAIFKYRLRQSKEEPL